MEIIAAAQIAAVCYDAEATTRKVVDAIAEAARHRAWLVVFPESCIPGYPEWAWRLAPHASSPSAEPFRAFERLFFEQAVSVPGPETELIAAACRAHQIMAVVGVTERPERAGTLYNTLLYFGPDGAILGRHRKMVPTFAERLVWGAGDGTTLRALTTPHGVVGGLICWENYMPLARAALYTQGVQFYVAPMQDSGDRWHATTRHIATEARAWVISTGTLQREADFVPVLRALGVYVPDELAGPGDSVIVDPLGAIVAGPAHGEETLLYAEAPASAALLARRGFDAVGHYGRGDVFALQVHGVALPLELNTSPSLEALGDHIWRVPGQESASVGAPTPAPF
jgi:nitrilase